MYWFDGQLYKQYFESVDFIKLTGQSELWH